MVTTHFMDEAEHCDEIGFIFEGNLLTSDTPTNLKKSLPGTLLAIPTTDPMALFTELAAGNERYLDVYPCGASLHVLAAPSQVGKLAVYRPEVIDPTLEDVFVHLVKTHRKEAVA
jgi:ABC-type multidrug transport system, ATPase component